MAWQSKRRYPAKRPARWSKRTAGVTRQQLDRKLSKRYQWAPVIDTMCTVEATDCKGCCVDEITEEVVRGCSFDQSGVVVSNSQEPLPIVLIPPAAVPSSGSEALYSTDTLTVVRQVGMISLCPLYCPSAASVAQCAADPRKCPAFNAFEGQFQTYHLRAGLAKDRWEFDPQTGIYSAPSRFPLDQHEWSDAQFLRQWERYRERPRMVHGLTTLGDAALGCCGDVSAAAAGAPANTLSSGSGTVNIPAISTDCEPCIPGAEDSTFKDWGLNREGYPCFTLSLNSRRRLTFRENEGLTLWMDWTSFTPWLAPDDSWRPNVGFSIRTQYKVLLEVA